MGFQISSERLLNDLAFQIAELLQKPKLENLFQDYFQVLLKMIDLGQIVRPKVLELKLQNFHELAIRVDLRESLDYFQQSLAALFLVDFHDLLLDDQPFKKQILDTGLQVVP